MIKIYNVIPIFTQTNRFVGSQQKSIWRIALTIRLKIIQRKMPLELIYKINNPMLWYFKSVYHTATFIFITKTSIVFLSLVSENMMTSSNGNIFRVTGPLCGEFTGPGEFPTQRPVTRSFDVFFDLRLNKRLSKQPWGWWVGTPSWSLWRHCNESRQNTHLESPEWINYERECNGENTNLIIR